MGKIDIKKLREQAGLTQHELADKTGIPRGRINAWEQRGSMPKAEDYQTLKDFFKNVTNVSHETYQSKRLSIKNGEKKGIPVFESLPTTLTAVELYRDDHAGQPDFWITIPNPRDCDYGTRAKGDSMHPLIRTNALIIGRSIQDFNVIVFGEIYTVITKNGIETTKYIHPHPSDPDKIILKPYNQKAGETIIHKSEIAKLYEAKAVFNTL